MADQAAKKAGIEKTNPPPQPTTLKSAQANKIHQTIKWVYQNQWINGKKTAQRLQNITKQNMTKRKPKRLIPSLRIYEKLNKRIHIAWIARLRTGHTSLNGYLKRFNIVDDATCPECGDARETVHHFLMVCPKHEELRDKMRREVGEGGMKEEKLLGDHRRIKHTVEFIEGTGRFKF